MAEADIDAMIATPSGDTTWYSDITGAWTTLKERLRPTHGVLEIVETTSGTGTYTINLANANVFNRTMTGNTTLAFTGWTSGRSCSVRVIMRQNATGGWTVTVPAAVKWMGSNPAWGTTASKIAGVAEFQSVDNGVTILGFFAGAEQ